MQRVRCSARERLLRATVALILAALAALPAAPPTVYAAAGQKFDLQITAVDGSITAGEAAQFRVELKNISGGPLPNSELRLPISGPVAKVRAEPDKTASGDLVEPKLLVRSGGVAWRGGMRVGGTLALDIWVKSAPSVGKPNAQITIDGQALQAGESDIEESAAVTVNGTTPVDEEEITLTKSILYRDGSSEPAAGPRVEIAPRQEVAIELALTNASDQVVYSLVIDEMQPTASELAAASAADDERCLIRFRNPRIVAGRGISVPPAALAKAGFSSDDNSYGFLVATAPNSTSTMRIRAQAAGAAGCEFSGAAEAFLTNLPPAQNGEFDAQNALALLPSFQQFPSVASLLALLIIVVNDFGDAPDSTNNFGTAMDAYVGVPNARFPTVFNPATGGPPGPVHINPYPLRLGTQVSWEFSADTGARRNIDPPGNAPSLDLFDDGVDVTTLNFPHCLPTTIPYAVTASQAAVNALASQNGTAYVNAWLDGNHDGDWEDSLNCDGLTASEHIVVDQQISINAPGTLNLVLATGNLPVPQNGVDEEMWLRITVSEQPSVKTAGNVGDGQGPATGFLLGETEDYLYQSAAAAPSPSARGADSRLDLESAIDIEDLAPTTLSAASTDALSGRYLNSVIRLRNSGDLPTGNVRLVLETTPDLGEPQSSDAKCCRCLTCTVASGIATPLVFAEEQSPAAVPFKRICADGTCRLEADLGYLARGDSGQVFVRWVLPPEVDEEVTVSARLVTQGDTNPANNQGSTLNRLPIRTPVITGPGPATLGWTGCLTCTVAAGADPSAAAVEVRGFAEPNSTLRIFADGFESGAVQATADGDGFWKTLLNLPDGSHELVAEYVAVASLPANAVKELDKSTPLLLLVDSTLGWNPASLGYLKYVNIDGEAVRAAEADDSCGPWQFADDLGRTDPTGWRIPVYPNSSHEIGVQLTCTSAAGAKLMWDGGSVTLTDNDGDGYYSAAFPAPAISQETPVELVISCGDVETSFAGSMIPVVPATVVDAATGNPLPSVEVTLWERDEDSGGTRFTAWEAQAYGQTNPQTTNSSGHFTFLTPPGRYGLTAQIDGYQSFRGGPFRLQGSFPSRTLALTPALAGAAAQVAITDDGFDPPAIRVPVGAVVEWTNTGLRAGSSTAASEIRTAGASPTGWDSGQLSSGASYRLRFDTAGVYSYVNAEDPAQEATIIVADAVAGNIQVFMPIVTK